MDRSMGACKYQCCRRLLCRQDHRQAKMKDDFNDWVTGLEEGEQPEACAIDDPDCEACGS